VAAAVLCRRDGAEDVLQEALVTALGRLNSFQHDEPSPAPGASTSSARGQESGNLFAWLSQIVRYTALNHRRRDHRRRVAPLDGAEPRAQADVDRASLSARGQLRNDQVQFDDEIMVALEQLEETPRACLLLRATLDLPYREIALALNIPEGTAMSHVHRARRAMANHLITSAPDRFARAMRQEGGTT